MTINPDAIIRDLESLGWKRFPRKRAGIAIYQHDDGEQFLQVIIPLDTELVDYQSAMLNTLKVISDFKRAELATVMKEYTIP